MATGTYLLTAIGLVIALLGGYIAVFGIPPQLKRELEEKVLEKMGENQASSMMQDAIGSVPASDQQDIKDVQTGLKNLGGGDLQNPLG